MFALLVFEGKQIHMRTAHVKKIIAKESPHVESNDDKYVCDRSKLTYPNSYAYEISRIPIFKKFGDWAGSIGIISQDVPFNRFVVYTFYYLIFLGMIIWKLLDPSLNHLPLTDKEIENWKLVHSILTLYLASFILEDLNYLLVHKQIVKAFKSFWRLFDCITHVILTISIVCHWTLYLNYNKIDYVSSGIYRNEMLNPEEKLKTIEDSDVSHENEDMLHQTSVLSFAIGNM